MIDTTRAEPLTHTFERADYRFEATEATRKWLEGDLKHAVRMRDGSSTDDELEALWECVRTFSIVTGIPIPGDFE